MKKVLLFLLLGVTFSSYSQKRYMPKMGKILYSELDMVRYEKDTTAKSIVLEEKAHTYISEKDNYDFRTDFYFRVKIFDKEDFNRATISIELFDRQKHEDIEAYSYNTENDNFVRTKLEKKDIYSKDLDQKWREVVFTIPNIKEGTVIEYKYSVISPYSTVDNWYFQSDIPKVKSDYKFTYLGNYNYNVRLIGFERFQRNEADLVKNCVNVPGMGRGSCGVLTYGMDSIPAFKEEDYMLSKENYISHLKFDLISFTNPNGSVDKYTKTWKDADRSFKKRYLDGQVNKKKFFKKNLPQDLLAIENPMDKARGIYQHIQDHFTWDERYWSYDKTRVKNAYEGKTGDVYDINLSLYNSLQAADIESYLVMIATRGRSVPTKLFPVTKDFNYVIVKAVVDGKSYFLDATDKFLIFGQIPLRCINGEGRVLDFDKGSYWESPGSSSKNSMKIWAKLKPNEENEFEGTINVVHRGYFASDAREELSRTGEEEYLRSLETAFLGYEIDEFSTKNKKEIDKSFMESFKIIPEETLFVGNKIRFNPFFYFRVNENPFKLNERNYPVDFGYKQNFNSTVNIEIPEGYKVSSIPDKLAVSMPNKSAVFVYLYDIKDNSITLNYRYQIKRHIFSSQEYFYLKEFYKKLIELFRSEIVFEKI